MIMIALVVVGAISVPLLPVDLYPNVTLPTVSVSTSWSGASPTQVESQITKPIEGQMATIANVTNVTSTSRSGSSVVSVTFNYGTNLDQATLNIRDKLGRVQRGLPSDAGTPVVNRVDPNAQAVSSLALYGNTDPITLRSLADNIVSPAVQRVDGVASVTVSGGRVRQINVEVDPNKLTQYGLSINSIVSALGSDNTSFDAGLVDKGSGLIPLHINGDFQSVADIGKVQISLGRGITIPISQLATINDTYQDVTMEARKDGQTSVSLSVFKQTDGNTVSVSDNLKKSLADIQSKLPDGVHVSVLNDQAQYIRDAISSVVKDTLLGAVFSIIILMLFLRSIRATLVIALTIPIAVISTFSMMYFSNQTINTMTLGGLSVGLGSLVDFSVVVLESIFRKRAEGLDPVEAAKTGTAEVGTAVMASALAQISVFAPAAMINGLAQQFLLPLALTVIFSHIAALFAAVTLVPMLASKILRGEIPDEDHLPRGVSLNPAVWFGHLMNRIYALYHRVLSWALRFRWTVVLLTIALLAGSLYLTKFIGTELTPATDEGQFRVSIRMPNGVSFDQTNQLTSKVEDDLKTIPDIATIFTTVGSGGGGAFQSAATNTASIQGTLKANPKENTSQVVEQIRTLTQNIYPGVQISASSSSGGIGGGGGGGGGGADISVVLTGPDLNVLQKLGDIVVQQINTVPNTRNVQSTLDKATPIYDVSINRDAAAHYGITLKDIQSTLRTAYQGSVATYYKTGDSQISVLVHYPAQLTNTLENMNNLLITSTSGTQVPITEVASVTLGSSPAQIQRINQQRQAQITASVFGATVGTVSQQVQQSISEIQPPDGYTIAMGDQQKQMSAAFGNLGVMLVLSILLVYMVMASQFESLYGPFIIMFSIPPTLIGAILGLFLTGRTINMNSIIGMIMLIGIVVNNAIVLIDYTNQLRKQGMPLYDALLRAGRIRLRPILMTTGATVLAMLPMVIGLGKGSESESSMATVVAFGLTLATMVTLVLVPVVYMIFDNWIDRFKRIFRRKTPNALAPDQPIQL
ncbi:MAG: swrC 2 [Bacilli bacterium]|nr:swrC 2 [Bacilli bacterium]